jgi:type IV pilus assembly protein PilB
MKPNTTNGNGHRHVAPLQARDLRVTADGNAGTPPKELRLGEILVRESVITEAQLQSALEAQAKLTTYVPLGHILVARKVISRERLKLYLQLYRRSSRLGEILVHSGCITSEQLALGLAKQRRSGKPVGETLVRLGFVNEEQLRRALSMQLHINFFDLDTIPLDRSLARLINARFARKSLVVPVARVGKSLVVAMDDPTRTAIIDDLRSSSGHDIEVITSTTASIRRAIEIMYPGGECEAPGQASPIPAAQRPIPIIGEPHFLSLEQIDQMPEEERPSIAEVSSGFESTAGIVRRLLALAVDRGASDIHLETVDRRLQTRFRIDGVLQQLDLDALDDALNLNRGKLMSRLKILSRLDISEKRRPQDGSFRARMERQGRTTTVDFRISIIPGYYGENAVIRILDPHGLPQSVEAVGLREPVAARLRHILRAPTGLVLVTGPTGSGKSTTLFASLKSVYQPGIKILTAENPIEYVCDDFSQHEVNERLGNTFANYLRSFLRHDPDVIMIGEIRDAETADLAFRAAQTGHLVLSTLHTNDALSALTRLTDLGVDPNMITSCLRGVLAQRLAREVCATCREPYTPAPALLQEYLGAVPADFRWYRGRGCAACNLTGYRGRLICTELWTPNDADVVLINRGAPFEEIQASARTTTLSMAEDIAEKLRQGRTNLEELIRALPDATLRGLRSISL